MIDLHCHLLPGIDDGAKDLDESLEMARVAVADGITQIACTPHIYPGLYENDGPSIDAAVKHLQKAIDDADINLRLLVGADVQLAPDMVEGLKTGRIPTLAGTRYFLFEPPHHVAPPRMEDMIFRLLSEGYVPIITHPERLTWIEDHYKTLCDAFDGGAWIQLTAGSVTGYFGRRAKYWSERMLDEGRVHIIASDGHNLRRRRPEMSAARDAISVRLGDAAALDMVSIRPSRVINDITPDDMPALVAARQKPTPIWRRWNWGKQ